MTYNGCKRWFSFSKLINGEPHEYKTTDGKVFYYKSHASWEVVWNEVSLEELRAKFNENVIG